MENNDDKIINIGNYSIKEINQIIKDYTENRYIIIKKANEDMYKYCQWLNRDKLFSNQSISDIENERNFILNIKGLSRGLTEYEMTNMIKEYRNNKSTCIINM